MSKLEDLKLTVKEAIDIRAILREKAEVLRKEAKAAMHSALISRINEAERLDELATRIEDWAYAEQERMNQKQRPRRAVKSKNG